MKKLVCGVLLFAACGVHAAERAHADIAQFVPSGKRVESRLDADITGDGVADAIFVSVNRNDFEAAVTVLMRLHGKPLEGKGTMQGFQSVDSLQLDLSPHGPPKLSVKNGILLVESVIGGNTVQTSTTYRYRFDPEEGRMRLIGLDAERTASTNAIKLSWNVLTGARIVRRGKRDPAAFVYGPESKSVEKAGKIYMSSTPNPDDLIDKLVR